MTINRTHHRQGVKLILMLLAINIGILMEGRGGAIPVIDATPQVYAKPGQWFVWSPAEHLAPNYRVKRDTLVLESRGSDNCIGKWAIELTDMKPGINAAIKYRNFC